MASTLAELNLPLPPGALRPRGGNLTLSLDAIADPPPSSSSSPSSSTAAAAAARLRRSRLAKHVSQVIRDQDRTLFAQMPTLADAFARCRASRRGRATVAATPKPTGGSKGGSSTPWHHERHLSGELGTGKQGHVRGLRASQANILVGRWQDYVMQGGSLVPEQERTWAHGLAVKDSQLALCETPRVRRCRLGGGSLGALDEEGDNIRGEDGVESKEARQLECDDDAILETLFMALGSRLVSTGITPHLLLFHDAVVAPGNKDTGKQGAVKYTMEAGGWELPPLLSKDKEEDNEEGEEGEKGEKKKVMSLADLLGQPELFAASIVYPAALDPAPAAPAAAAAAAAAANTTLTSPTPDDHTFADYVTFVVAHTLAVLQEHYELQHNDLHPGNVLLVPADKVTVGGRLVSERHALRYTWGDRTYEFPVPAVLPKLIDFGMSSCRVDHTIVEKTRPNLLPPFEPLGDLHRFYRDVRRRLPWSKSVATGLEEFFRGGGRGGGGGGGGDSSIGTPRDPFQRYLVGLPVTGGAEATAAGAAASPEIISRVASTWMPALRPGRNAGYVPLEKLSSAALDDLRRRCAAQGAGSLHMGRLQQLFYRAKISESRAATARLRQAAAAIGEDAVIEACGKGGRALLELVGRHLGAAARRNAERNTAKMSEEKVVDALGDVLVDPAKASMGLFMDE